MGRSWRGDLGTISPLSGLLCTLGKFFLHLYDRRGWMKEVNLGSWEELEEHVSEVNRSLAQKRMDRRASIVSRPLFRGQCDSTWGLETTIERYSNDPISLEVYNDYLWSIRSAIESYTEKKWEFKRSCDVSFDIQFFDTPPNYEFMAYARHHGFPSPLLDWSQSLYIALFFAYKNAEPDTQVSLYQYVEDLGLGKSGAVGSAQINELGPYVSTHKRHFMQQGQYTVSIKKKVDTWYYTSHEDYFSNNTDDEQDMLIKYILPGAIRADVLNKLQGMNVNSFTLYGSEEGLFDMLAFKEKDVLSI